MHLGKVEWSYELAMDSHSLRPPIKMDAVRQLFALQQRGNVELRGGFTLPLNGSPLLLQQGALDHPRRPSKVQIRGLVVMAAVAAVESRCAS